MAVLIGHAVCDEDGKARGGDPGDQNGREVRTQNWYLNGKGWRVFRANDPVKAKLIAEDMRKACANNNIGYDQGDRNTLYAEASTVGFDCARVNKLCEADCSSLVRVCLAYAGIKVGNFSTATEASILLKSGAFTEMIGDKYTKDSAWLRTGDVLVTRTKGHTLVVLTDGPKAYSEDKPAPEKPSLPTNKIVHVLGNSVWVRKGDNKKTPILMKAKKGNEFELIDIAPTNWYHIKTDKGDGYISNRKDLTRVQEV